MQSETKGASQNNSCQIALHFKLKNSMKYLFILLSFVSTRTAHVQIDKYHLTAFATIYKDAQGEFVRQDEWAVCNWLATIDPKAKVAVFYINGKEIKFDLVSATNVTDEEGDAILKFICVDENGKCGLTFVTLADQSAKYRSFIKLEWSNKAVMYRFTGEN
jgi:hypothetical protein